MGNHKPLAEKENSQPVGETKEFTLKQKLLMNNKLKELGLTPAKFDNDYNRILRWLHSRQ